MKNFLFLLFFQFVISIQAFANNQLEVSLSEHDGIAITTDLEPDDVFALAMIFKEANRLYSESPQNKYPIDLIVVGEGNAAIKKLRMEHLLKHFFQLPYEVNIPVVAGQSTISNQFTKDGEEIFDLDFLSSIPFPSENHDAISALENWNAYFNNPLLILLKPSPEIFYMDLSSFSKTTLFLYGSFNVRKTINHIENSSLSIQEKLEDFVSTLSKNFHKVFILESFGVLGEESQINRTYQWAKPIEAYIRTSEKPFLVMFKSLSNNWNQYVAQKFLVDGVDLLSAMDFTELKSELKALTKSWSVKEFQSFYEKIEINQVFFISSDLSPKWKKFTQQMGIVKSMFEGVQFTLADVLAAIALTEKGLMKAQPIQATYNGTGYLVPIENPTSNVLYFERVEHKKICDSICNFLENLSD